MNYNRSKVPTPANFGWVGLAAPGEPGSWQYEMKVSNERQRTIQLLLDWLTYNVKQRTNHE